MVGDHYDYLTGWYLFPYLFETTERALRDRRNIAELFRHPGSCNESQDILLKRFEELVFHDGRQAYLIPESKEDSKDSDATKAPRPEAPPRRLRSVHDAAAARELRVVLQPLL